jgi:hypothetical protein
MATKGVESAAGDDFDDEDVVKGGLAEEIWKRELPLPSIAGATGKDGVSHYPSPCSPPPTTATSTNSESEMRSMPSTTHHDRNQQSSWASHLF